uniref:Uncharacterized protein n=1 Tax=Anguilla anguilla TaxID=7936 RepID=A0A0E9Q280_ANGAN
MSKVIPNHNLVHVTNKTMTNMNHTPCVTLTVLLKAWIWNNYYYYTLH